MTLDLAALNGFISPDKNPVFIVSVSGGRDSTATSLALTEAGIEHERVFADTGWENEEITIPYIRNVLTAALGPITEVHGVTKDGDKLTMSRLVEDKGMFPSRTRRFCTVELKVLPLKRHLSARAKETGRPVVNVIGIRRDESQARKNAVELEADVTPDGTLVTIWRPIVTWTAEDVRAIHERHGVAWNPLYDLGARRVGCWPCINASKGELRAIGRIDPKRVAHIAALEKSAQEKAEARYTARGETFESLGHLKPTFFMRGGLKSETDTAREWPIEKVMQWAKTSRGGRQYEIDFAAGEDDSCASSGLCEVES